MPGKRNSRPTANPMPLILIGGGLILVISILLWQALSGAPQNPSAKPTVNINIPYSNVPRVSLADAKASFDNKSAVFVDVRDLDVYNADHIPGALNIPLGEFDARYSQLDPNQWIITYCT